MYKHGLEVERTKAFIVQLNRRQPRVREANLMRSAASREAKRDSAYRPSDVPVTECFSDSEKRPRSASTLRTDARTL